MPVSPLTFFFSFNDVERNYPAMSIKAMTWVWELQELTQSETLVMLSLADAARDDGVCWPSQAVIAKKSRMSVRNIRRVISRLTDSGCWSARLLLGGVL